MRAPNATECRFCGSTPSASVTFRGHQGIIVIARFLKTSGPFCRDCGIATFRQMTADTLKQGRWSVISIFATPVTVLVNLFRRSRVTSLGPPQKDPSVLAPLAVPMSPGKPVLARPSVWILVVIMVGLVGLGIAGAAADEAKRSVGGCTRGLEFVDCGENHDGVILKIVTDKSNCPVEADAYLQERSRIYCLKDS